MYEHAIKKARRRPLVDVDAPPGARVDYGVDIVERLIRHRPPFRFVDGIDAIDLDTRTIVGHVTVAVDNPIFAGHFPEYAVFPGVCHIEAIGQMALCLTAFLRHGRTTLEPTDEAASVRATKVHHAQFMGEVLPGERVTLIARVLDADEFLGTTIGQVVAADGAVRSLAVGEVYFVNAEG